MKKNHEGETIHQEILKEVLVEEEALKKEKNTVLWLVLAVLLGVLVILMIIPYWKISVIGLPTTIPSLSSLNLSFLTYNTSQNHSLNEAVLLTSPSPSIRTVAEMILLQSCPKQGVSCGAQALYYFVRDNIYYLPDPLTYELIKEPAATLLTGKGDCDDHAVLLASLMKSIGIPTELVFLPQHMIIKIYLEEAPSWMKEKDGWIYLDPTCKSCSFGKIEKKWQRYLS